VARYSFVVVQGEASGIAAPQRMQMPQPPALGVCASGDQNQLSARRRNAQGSRSVGHPRLKASCQSQASIASNAVSRGRSGLARAGCSAW
jgi:hypothetical protein